MGRTRFRWAGAAAAVVVIIAGSDAALAQGRLGPRAQADDFHRGPSQEELAGIGCIVAGTAAVLAVGAIGIASGAAAGGASAGSLALPVLGTAFAAGCGVGVMAAPGAAWLIDHYVLGAHRVTNGAGAGHPNNAGMRTINADRM